MDSDCLRLPVIDFSDQTLRPGTSNWEKVRLSVHKALEEYGCFEATFKKVSMELDKSMLEAIKELFELPIQTKQKNVSEKPFHGYFSLNIYESLGVDDANVLEKVNEFTKQLWPDHGNKSISETIHKFSHQLVELEMMVRRMIMESFGIERYNDEHLKSTNYLMRLMKYTPPDVNDDVEGLGSHTDKNILTILHQYGVDGLEVKTKDDKWIKVKPSQDSFVIMVADSLCALLNGRLSSPFHRVQMKGQNIRYSTALFSSPKSGVVIESPEELVDEEHPRLFKPFEYDDFLNFFHTEAGRKAESALHAYCAL